MRTQEISWVMNVDHKKVGTKKRLSGEATDTQIGSPLKIFSKKSS